MTVNVLIDAIVRQTTVLIAHLATTSGTRATLAHVANELFLSLTQELRAQGVGHKVIADMFGMLLRSYHKKVRRLSESQTDRGRTLWEAVFSYIEEEGDVARADLLTRFRYDDEDVVRGVLRDLTDSGLISKRGRGDSTRYSMAPDVFETVDDDEMRAAALAELLNVAVYRNGPITTERLAEEFKVEAGELQPALDELVDGARIIEERAGNEVRYRAETYLVPFEWPAGWEAAVFDHFQAVVTTIIQRLDHSRTGASRTAMSGGSTYAFDLWEGHPLEGEVLDQLKRLRTEIGVLRKKVDDFNAENGRPAKSYRVTIYHGQHIAGDD